MNTDKKNQHYIPKFYLRNFSYQNNEKQIGIFNIHKNFFYPTSKLKTQGSKNFFYGYDGRIEDGLSKIEGKLSAIIRNIITDQKIPVKETEAYIKLLIFVGLTHLRNPVTISYIKQSREAAKRSLFELDPNVNVDDFIPKARHDEAISLALSSLRDVVLNITDLNCKLIVNRTTKPFISSDFPIVKYNQFLERKNWQHGKTGYGNIGLQIIIPINPYLSLFFYDSEVYKIGFKKSKLHNISDEKEIEQFNILQILNCVEHVYFNHEVSENYMRDLFNKSSKYKKANEVIAETHFGFKKGEKIDFENKRKNVLAIGTTDCEIKLNIAGLKAHSKATYIKLGNRASVLRKLAFENMRNNR